MRGIYKKGNLLQSIEFIDKFQVASDILFDAYMKDKDNLKVLELRNYIKRSYRDCILCKLLRKNSSQ
jgi:hypothetical protein